MRRGLVDSRQEAQAAVAAGSVLVSGTQADKPARLVAPDEPVVLLGPPSPYVGRGGLKLEAALDRFPIAVTGRRALDAGASTGGFTDCLLQRGAAHVYAVDVGHGQLHPPCATTPRDGPGAHQRADPHRGGAAAADPAYEPCPLVVADLSFISLRSVVPALDRPGVGARRRPGPPGQAAVRGGPRRRLPGQGRDPGPRPLARRPRGRGVRAASTRKPASWERWFPP